VRGDVSRLLVRVENALRYSLVLADLFSMSVSRLARRFVPAMSVLVVILVASACSTPAIIDRKLPSASDDVYPVTVFQSRTCECCLVWSAYLKKHGFHVVIAYTEDTYSLKQRYQIPLNMASCHTAIIDNYFVEGHVPIEAIYILLAEQPDIDGIVLPGMPSGSPGMPGTQTEPFIIYALSDGIPSEFMVIK
jgi:hypothetical protein